MAYKATDGSGYTNRSGMLKQNSKLAAAKPMGAVLPAAGAEGDQDADNQDITQDPEAMQALDYLAQKGYSIEQITEAYQQLQAGTGEPDGDEQQAAQGGAPQSSGMMG
jgi:hypothetical protein